MRADTIFRIYSMTKAVGSVAVMMLYDEGRSQLDVPAAEYLPSLRVEMKVELLLHALEDHDHTCVSLNER